MTLGIDFAVEDERWAETLPFYREVALRAADAALRAVDVTPERLEISVLLCDDARMAELNEAHRGKAKPTNVLSWPAAAIAPADAPQVAPGGFLGDVALARETLEREASALHLGVETYFMRLFAHGVLHLLGYDHETDDDAARMEAAERRGFDELGTPFPAVAMEEAD